MRRRLLFFIFTFSILFFVVHAFALKYDLYFVTTWFDSISHTLGGMVVAGVFFYLSQLKGVLPRIMHTLAFVLVIGILWEFFELYKSLTHTSDPGYYLDTAGDIFFDLFGAYITHLFVFKKIYATK